MEIGYIKPRRLTDEMQESYLDYAMSVIVSRALPDVRDGLKPVHRRILFAMWRLGLRSSHKYRKSATVVGEVLGKYHPHGDAAVYDSLVRMAQEFSLRYPLVDGQGNFGSIDGDGAAAMRYTECRLAPISDQMLFDLDKDTVDFVDNYDRSQKEPLVLPAKLPNLLLNGTMGIAVGMATNIPPHNLGEVVDGINFLIENPKGTIEDLVKIIKGPDFPTGGLIFNKKDILNAYATGKGPVVMRAKTEIIEGKRGLFSIITTELPYQVNKAALIEKIAKLVKDKKIEGIKDIRDESDKEGIRLVIELKKEAFPKKVLNRLYSITSLQEKFHLNLLALVDGLQPRVLNLKMLLEYYIKHRQEVITRRTEYLLAKAKAREHILEGLKKALDHIDEIIETIKRSRDRERAHKNLVKKFKFSDLQAEAILDMRLAQLSNLERRKIEEELKAIRQAIKEYEALLADPKKVLLLIKDELAEIKEKYDNPRRTKIVASAVDKFSQEDLVPDVGLAISLTKRGYIKSLPEETYKAQRRGGKGVSGGATKEGDVIKHLLSTTAHANLLFFTNKGRVFQLKAYEIPQSSRQAKGQSIVNFIQLSSDERVTTMLATKDDDEAKYLAMATTNGLVKKVKIEDFKDVRRSGLIAIKLNIGDELKWVARTSGADEIILITSLGQAIRFREKNIRPMGRPAAGVHGIRLKKDDVIVGAGIVSSKTPADTSLMIITANGYGKRTPIKLYKTQSRGGSGLKTAKVTPKNGPIVSASLIDQDLLHEMIVISRKGQTIRFKLDVIPTQGRATQGVRLMRLKGDDQVASVACL